MPDKKRRNPQAAAPAIVISEPQIAERAYHKWLARGCPVTDGREDWFAAHAELLAEVTPVTTGKKRKPKTRAASQKAQAATARVANLYDTN